MWVPYNGEASLDETFVQTGSHDKNFVAFLIPFSSVQKNTSNCAMKIHIEISISLQSVVNEISTKLSRYMVCVNWVYHYDCECNELLLLRILRAIL